MGGGPEEDWILFSEEEAPGLGCSAEETPIRLSFLQAALLGSLWRVYKSGSPVRKHHSPHPGRRQRQAGARPGWQWWGGEFVYGGERAIMGAPGPATAEAGPRTCNQPADREAGQRQQAPIPPSLWEGLGPQLPCAPWGLLAKASLPVPCFFCVPAGSC